MSEAFVAQVRASCHCKGSTSNGVRYSPFLPLSTRQRHQSGSIFLDKQTKSHARITGRGRPSIGHVAIKAVAAPEAPDVRVAFEKQFPLGSGHTVTVVVDEWKEGLQNVRLFTNRPGRLLLHWGVEGGRDYQGGWRLPGPDSQPPGTVDYKNRALQTPFQQISTEEQELKLAFKTDVPFDFLNFVIKDESTGTWYDLYSSNFHIPLGKEAQVSVAGSIDDVPLIPDAELPVLPDELCGIWAYIKWEAAGCPNRSQEDSDKEFRSGIEELKQLLRIGVPLEELWKVARGELKYADYAQQTLAAKLEHHGTAAPKEKKAPAAVAAAPAGPPPPAIPQDLLNIEAYLLWEKAGRPEGADFSSEARRTLEEQLRSGKTLQDLERMLKAPPPPAPEAPAAPPPPSSNGTAGNGAGPAVLEKKRSLDRKGSIKFSEVQFDRAPSIKLGDSIGKAVRNPLDLIKSGEPLIVQEKRKAAVRALDGLEDAAARDESCIWHRAYPLGNKLELLVAVRQRDGKDGPVDVTLTTDLPGDVYLHWGVRKGNKEDWILPAPALVPASSLPPESGGIAIDTPFTACTDGDCQVRLAGDPVQLQRLSITIPKGHDLAGLSFVLRSGDRSMWWRDGGRNFNVPVPGGVSPLPEEDVCAFDDQLSCEIVHCETKADQWTLMHRYNKAADFLEAVLQGQLNEDVTDAMARIFVWLRYSASRQLTWQRNYNTQPRILGEAQRRLTHAIADAHSKTGGEAQEWVRAMLGTVGRGGNAQAVRDEILNIMHRHHIPEKRGTWMEDWHQKLHNNTTPDDVAICDAFIRFLERGGDMGAYWATLSEYGVTRERLESFDRPIMMEPADFPDKRDALIGEFRNYLGILKAVHSGADLQASAQGAGDCLPGGAKGHLGYVLSHQGDNVILPLMENAVEARLELQPHLAGNRELLYLDLALENVVRQAAERGAGAAGAGAAALIGPLLQNLVLSTGNNEELCYCLKAWQSLPPGVQAGVYPSRDDALKAAAVVDRIRRAIATTSDEVSARIAPIATAFGREFGVDDWYVQLFAEEVVRGGPAFAVSLVLSSVEPALRAAAELGAWQVISPVNALGRVEVVSGLHEVQDKVYEEPTVLVAKRVTGEEEVPEGVVAVLTPDAPDVLSHLSVRARNMRVLFAICHDAEPLKQIEALAGKALYLETTAAGGVTWEEVEETKLKPSAETAVQKPKRNIKISIPKWCGKWVVSMDEYAPGIVGAKSKNLAGLRGKLPSWINLPPSVTVPFSCFEESLRQAENKEVARRLEAAIAAIPPTNAEAQLQVVRDICMEVVVPEKLQTDLKAAMEKAGIPVPSPDRWEDALNALRGVWASKYNERALLSMKKVGLDFRDLRMAVLVQRVVPAAYAFVIHTHNPTNGSAEEIFGELVIGLGESIVSGMVPGSSLAFLTSKNDLDSPKVLMYASKGEGMFVPESLIFRSDSNGEDLEGYAGAGLYDSITMDPSLLKKVDYSEDRLMKDEGFRRQLLANVAKVGNAIEEALGSAQDIEGCVEADGSITVVQTRPQM